MAIGRPLGLTDEIERQLCDYLSAGSHKMIACGMAGIPHRTFNEWMRRGREEPASRYGEFLRAINGAIRKAEWTLAASAFQGSLKDPRVALDFLARRHPERWAKQAPVKHEISGKLSLAADDPFQALARALARIAPAAPPAAGTPATGPEDSGQAVELLDRPSKG